MLLRFFTKAIVIYPCVNCDGLDLRTSKAAPLCFCQQERKKMVEALRKRIEGHQHVVEEHTQWIRTFTIDSKPF